MDMQMFREMRGENHMPADFGPTNVPLTSCWEMAPYMSVRFETEAKALKKILPPMLEPAPGNIVIVYENKFRNVNLIAGRGYNFFGIGIPAVYEKDGKTVTGNYIPVCWVNDGYAMLLGREGAGYPKLFANVTDPVQTRTGFRSSVCEYDHKLIEIEVSDLVWSDPAKLTKDTLKGNLFLRKTVYGFGDTKEVDYVTTGGNESTLTSYAAGKGKCTFFEASWEQAPASYNALRALRELPVLEWKGGSVSTGELWNKGSGIGRSIIE